MDIITAILLGILQGITEWLPISSSGHLALVQNIFNLDAPVVFDVFIHMGTLVAVCAVYRKDILSIIRALITLDLNSREVKLVALIILAMIPTAVIGFIFKPFFESMFKSNLQVGIALLFTGILLFVSSKARPKKNEVNAKSSFIIGIAQGISIAPGISRSGATISTGLLRGINAKKAARFSFLLSIPAIIGATIFEIKDAAISFDPSTTLIFSAGAIAAAIVGYFSIKILLRILEKGKFSLFAYYCWAIGIIIVVTSLF